MPGVMLDLGPLRSSRPFRVLFVSRAVALIGVSLTLVALSVQAYDLTGSSLAVGTVNAVAGTTLVAGTLLGGVLADRLERRALLLIARAAAAGVFAVLALNAASDRPGMLAVYACAAVLGVVDGVGETALVTVTPELVRADQLAAAGALTAITTQLATMVGPSVAGLVAAGPGVAACYAVTCAATVAQVALMLGLPRLPAAAGPEEEQARHPLRALAQAWRFVRSHRVVAGLLLVELCGGLFALPYAVFPAMGERVLAGDARTVGLLYSAPAVGAFLGALFSGWAGRIRRPGGALLAAGLLWGAAMAGFGAVPSLPAALVLLGLAGMAMVTAEILQRALLQRYTPSALLGRVSSFWLVLATAGPAGGGALAGGLAQALGPAAAVVVGGLVCTGAVAAVAVALPGLRRAEPAP
ncbi:enterobactin transporter EntS [Streptomonospora salina]|uniref:ENTS family enterobactin (Siderophore) exporter n=1 Tax=Streptomonospora salina TaxID=104205 RepID=A0A841ELL3_9ACTN|nr:enterobactin transporter EntS [Streptomonospora salina]MBB6001190.1 ENTS family enterobactin (siderophore) exporter [Streptomonospora salina]